MTDEMWRAAGLTEDGLALVLTERNYYSTDPLAASVVATIPVAGGGDGLRRVGHVVTGKKVATLADLVLAAFKAGEQRGLDGAAWDRRESSMQRAEARCRGGEDG